VKIKQLEYDEEGSRKNGNEGTDLVRRSSLVLMRDE